MYCSANKEGGGVQIVIGPFVLPLPPYFLTNRCKKGGVSENRSSFSLLYVVVQIRGGVQIVMRPFVLPPPVFHDKLLQEGGYK